MVKGKMHKYIINMLECPICHQELDWEIKEENQERIIEAKATCPRCGIFFPVIDEIGYFLTDEIQRKDLWEESGNHLDNQIKKYPELEDKLMNSPLESISPADQFIRAMVLEERKEFKNAKHVFSVAWEGLYTPEYSECWDNQIKYVIDAVKDMTSPIVDLASGRGYLVERLAKSTENQIIATDFSPRVLKRNKAMWKETDFYDQISLLAFDARMTPFKSGSVNIMTANLGLPNIVYANDVTKELRRIVSGELMSIMYFYPVDDFENIEALKKAKLEEFSLRSSTIDIFNNQNWKTEIKNEYKGLAKPTPDGKIMNGVKIDGFPIADTVLEWCTLVAK